MEAERPSAPGPGCRRPPSRAAGRDPAAAPMSVPAPPQGPALSDGFAGLEFAPPPELEPRAPGTWAGSAAGPPKPSAHVPVPADRAPQGKARLDEVLAAAALTSLSTCPLLLGAPAAAFSTEPSLQPWQEGLDPPSSPGSGPSADWGWDPASEQSTPATPSPPLPPEAAHFLFGEPAPRKRKGAVQVLFQCLWKRCGTVLSSASAMQTHIRLVHLGCGGPAGGGGAGRQAPASAPPCCVPSRRQAETEQSDGEEDFYYTELDSGLDVLSDGPSGRTPASPTSCPLGELPEHPALPSLLHPLALPPPQGCLAPTRLEPQPTTGGAGLPTLPSKLGGSLRKPRGDAKKCRKVYGTERRDLWCAACRWKKACRRFLD